jgi:hypothetical protein
VLDHNNNGEVEGLDTTLMIKQKNAKENVIIEDEGLDIVYGPTEVEDKSRQQNTANMNNKASCVVGWRPFLSLRKVRRKKNVYPTKGKQVLP